MDPVVLTALDKVRWRASVNPATSTPCPGVMDGQHHECLVASHAKDHGAEQPWVYLDARAVRKAIKDTRRDAAAPLPLLAHPDNGGLLLRLRCQRLDRVGRLLHVAAAHRVVRRLRPPCGRGPAAPTWDSATACAPTCSACPRG